MSNHDTLQRFLFEDYAIRGELVHLNASYQTIQQKHDYPLPIRQLLGQALAASALLSASLKFEGSLIIQTKSDGLVDPLVAQCTNELQMRGIAKWQQPLPEQLPQNLLGTGHLAITVVPNNRKKRYQGVVELHDDHLAPSLENYFLQSEQLPTRIWLTADENSCHGLLLQKMPDEQTDIELAWEQMVHLADTISDQELRDLPNETILHRLFHEHDVRLFDADPVCFRCSCNLQKMQDALRSCGKEETEELLKTHRTIEVNCEFCNQNYEFDKVDVAEIFRE